MAYGQWLMAYGLMGLWDERDERDERDSWGKAYGLCPMAYGLWEGTKGIVFESAMVFLWWDLLP